LAQGIQPSTARNVLTGRDLNLRGQLNTPVQPGMGINMSPDYRATQFEDMEYFGPSMTEKEWLDRQQKEMMGGTISRSPMADSMWSGITNTNVARDFPLKGTITGGWPGTYQQPAAWQNQQFPVRQDFYPGIKNTQTIIETGQPMQQNQWWDNTRW
jgi:hypothetical protein